MIRSTELRDITEHALFYREPSDCHVYGRGCVTLLGDAAHLTAAALGQVQIAHAWLSLCASQYSDPALPRAALNLAFQRRMSLQPILR